MVKGRSRQSFMPFLSAFLSLSSNRFARFAITLTPEQLSLREGVRAGVITALALLPSLLFDAPLYAWSAFSCFWACLIDPGGPQRERFEVLGGFTLAGSLVVALASWGASFGPVLILPIVALIGLGCGISRIFSPAIMQLWVLVGCAGLAATGFPSQPAGALAIAGLFFGGGALASLFCLVLWRQHPYAPARRSLGAVFFVLGLMARELAAGRLRETVHRQSVRNAIERARALIRALDARHGNQRVRMRMEAALSTAERLFTALLALEHLAEAGRLVHEARVPIRAMATICHETMRQLGRYEPDFSVLRELVRSFGRQIHGDNLVQTMPFVASVTSLEAMIGAFSRRSGSEAGRKGIVWRRPGAGQWLYAARLSVALCLTELVCLYGGQGFSYWALIAALLVMQPAGHVTLIRSVERVTGSLGGSLLAACFAILLPGKAALLVVAVFLSLAAIAVRAVNYTLLVFFLTGLIVVIAEAVMPGEGIVWTRVLDNTIGSLVALLCVSFPRPGRELGERDTALRRALVANYRYAALVLSGDCDPTQTDRLQREAGIATIAAEFSQNGLPLFGGLAAQLRESKAQSGVALLKSLRCLSGEMTLYRFDMLDGLRAPAPAAAREMALYATRLEAGAPLPDSIVIPGDEVTALQGQAPAN
ncbi:FUSC family protein [Swaminathania salitolerans]|uniref:FUSC family protein n=1 Tax=Swaminathania salitolerans TaxID=182838 RepID=A0A511BLM4_9PROT|nr:FUSC family protein [Swaminathania salitolerans]GBQ10324.1 hypothetical protein AA21291_0391 [Swaminathania salitolerans LMG 21291]GEL01250.1 FUSC family protein [Swaminathania salitolerans]